MQRQAVLSIVLTIVLVLIAPSSNAASNISLNFKISLAGIEIKFPTQLSVHSTGWGNPINFVAAVDLTEFDAKLNDIIRSAKLHQPPGDYQSFNYNGTGMQPDGNRCMWMKYHFRIDPRRMKPTNGSVELTVCPRVETDALRLVAENPKLNISNDIARALVKAFDIDKKIMSNGLGEINQFLASTDAKIQLPEVLRAANARLTDARFDIVENRKVLVVNGTLDFTAELIGYMFGKLRQD